MANQDKRLTPQYESDDDQNIMSLRDAMKKMMDESVWDPFGFMEENGRDFPTFESGYPRVNVSENNKEVTVTADVPGAKPDDVNVEVDEDSVTISGESKNESEKTDDNFYRYERHYGSFNRVVPLPSPVNSDKANAEVDNGTLTVTLPKQKESQKKKVSVKKKESK